MSTSPNIGVRIITEDEAVAWLRCVRTGFLMERTELEDAAAYFLKHRTVDRTIGAFDGDVVCGTTGSFAADLSVPGGATIPMGGVTAVTVLPTHRRRGVLTRMMNMQMRDSIERGEIAGMLIAAEWPIYGRFGYGVAVDAVRTVVDARTATFRDQDWHGTIELVDAEELRSIAPKIFDQQRLTCPGAISRFDWWWDEILGIKARPGEPPNKKRVFALHRDEQGEPDGYVKYQPDDGTWTDNRPNNKIKVSELITTTPGAYADLWRYLASIDWITTVEAGVRPVDEPLRHLLVDGRGVMLHDRSDHMWVRLFDVPAALSARRYTCADRLVIEVVADSLDRGGRFVLEGGPDGAACTPTVEEPDLVLPATALGSTYLGGNALERVAIAGGVVERTPRGIARYDAMFLTPTAPWATTGF